MARAAGLRRTGALAGVLALVSTSVLTVLDPEVARADELADVLALAGGVSSLLDTLDELPSVESLADDLPFAGVSPAQLLQVDPLVDALRAKVDGFAGTTGAQLQSFLNDPDSANGDADDGTIAGAKLDVQATVSISTTGASTVSLTLALDGSTVTTPFQLASGDANGDTLPDTTLGGTLTSGVTANLGFALSFDATRSAGSRLRVASGSGAVSFNASATLTNAAMNVGILGAKANGTISTTGSVNVALVDPDGVDGTTLAELANTAPGDLYDASFGSVPPFTASGTVDVTASVSGLAGANAKITVGTDGPAPGVKATFALGSLVDFQNASPLDIINALGQLGASLGAMQTSGLTDLQLPFTSKSLAQLFDLAIPIKDFMVSNSIATAEDPLSPGSDPAFIGGLENFDTVGEVADLLGSALGLPSGGDVPISYDPATKRLRFDLDTTFTDTFTFAPDFTDAVSSIGITSVTNGGSSASATATATLDLGFGIDLGAPSSTALVDRLFIDAAPANEIKLDLPVMAELNFGAAIGFVGLTLTDSNPVGNVPLLTKRAGDTGAMLRFDIADGPTDDGVLTLGELLAGLEANTTQSLGTLGVNVAVPSTTLTATATASGTTLATGTFAVAWPDVTTGTPQITSNLDFDDHLLDFAFDTANPLALFTQLLDAVQAIVDGFRTTIAGSPVLTTALPVIGTSFGDIADKFAELRDSLDAIIGDPAATLQAFETELENLIGTALGVAPGSRSSILTFTLQTPGGGPAVILVSLDLGICSAAVAGCTIVRPVSMPINLDLGSSSVVGVSGGGEAALTYAATISLDAGVELPAVQAGGPGGLPSVSGAPVPFLLDSSRVQLSVGADVTTAFTAWVGPLSANIGVDQPGTPENDPARARIGASFVVANPGFGGSNAVDRVPLAQIGTFLAGALPTSIQPTSLVSCVDGSPGNAAACAHLPVYFNGTKLGVIDFSAPDLLNPGGWTLTGVDAVLANLVAQAWNWQTLLQGLQAVLDQIEAATDGESFGASLPIVGDALDAGADVAKAFNDHVVTPVNTSLAALNGAANALAIETVVDDALTNALSGAGLLIDRGASGTADDVEVVTLCTAALTSCGDGALAFDVRALEVQLAIGKQGSAPITFDLGLPGLSLKVNDDPTVTGDELNTSVKWQLDLAFGISRTDGFYLRTDNPIRGAANGELSVEAGVDLPDSLFGTLAFIPVNLIDTHAGDDFTLAVQVDVASGGGRLSFGDLIAGLAPGVGLTAKVKFDALLDEQFVTGLSPSEVQNFGQNAPSLPTFQGVFHLKWGFGAGVGTDIGAFATSAPPEIAIQNVSLDVGSFIGDFLRPIASELDRFARPIKPVLDVLNAPIPGVKEIAELVGQNPPTMLDLIDLQNGPESTVMIRRLIILVDFITALNSGANGTIQLGTLNINGANARVGAYTGTEAAEKLIAGVVNGLPEPLKEVANKLTGTLKDKFTQATDQGGFTFPAFDNPSSLLGILVGQDVDIVKFDAGKLGVEFSKTFKYGPPIGPLPLSVGVTVAFKVSGHLAVGYDTRGIRKAIERLTNDDPNDNGFFGTVATLFQGVYLDDNKDGVDVPEISLFGSVSAQAAVDILIAEAGIRGGAKANLDLNLHDGGPIGDEPYPPENLDGKLRIEEIIEALAKNPICLFDTSGKFTVFFELYEDNIISGEDTWPVAEATIADFDDLFTDACTDDPPKLAHVENDGTLILHVGPYAPDRQFDVGQTNETMTVRRTGTDATGKAIMTVSGFGFSQEYPGVVDVWANGGSGNDNLTLLAGGTAVPNPDPNAKPAFTGTALPFNVQTMMCGGGGNDVLTGGDVKDEMAGDGGDDTKWPTSCIQLVNGGDDTLNGGNGDDFITGQGGNDTVGGGNGVDGLYGDDGNDVMNGGPDGDTMFGGNHDDNLVGGDGVDTINGDGGNDHITGGSGGDTVNGGPGDDKADGGEDGDTINGNEDHDLLIGGMGVDTIHGNDGDDDAFGDAGDDHVFGDKGLDDLVGGAGADDVHGGDDRDYLLGDDGTIVRAVGAQDGSPSVGAGVTGTDTLDGDGGNDVMYGQRGVDTMRGGTGSDSMYGGSEGDVMNGNEDADTMYGEAGNDTMHGDDGGDTLYGGDNADTMFGDGGNDLMWGDSGTDTMQGGLDIDTQRGGIGADCMAGNEAGDTMYGEAADDRMAGGSFVAAADDGADIMDGGAGDDVMTGDNADVCNGKLVLWDQPFLSAAAPSASWSGDDTMTGGDGADVMYGQGRNETLISGDAGDDYIEGNAGDDVIDGGSGADDLVGGNGHDLGGAGGTKRTFPDVADGSDTIRGGPGVDNLAGDNADLVRGTTTRTLELFDVPFVDATVSASASGGDLLYGGDDPDKAYGQGGNDLVDGEGGDDYLEGNAGVDTVNGRAGQDDMVGGSGRDDGPASPGVSFRKLADVRDAGDIMDGGADQDVMLGDNGSIVRPGTTGLFGTIDRDIELYDVQKIGGPSVSALVSGGELPMKGGTGNDVMFGQGGNDRIEAGDDEDYAEGNHGDDVMLGGAGEDDLIGGGSSNTGVISPTSLGDGLLDGVDLISGDGTDDTDRDSEGTQTGNGADVEMGDNARVIKQTSGVNWLIGQGTQDIVRSVVQFDVENVNAPDVSPNVHGGDTLWGNSNDDVMRGQGGPDSMYGGAGDDDMEGNPDADVMYGQGDQDDMIGGSRVAGRRDMGDTMYGGLAADFQLGDNGDLVREVTGLGTYRMYAQANATTIVRTTTRHDLAGNALAFGGDLMYGEAGDDYQWGQDGDDTMYGGSENDDMYGELGNDTMYGDAGEDAMLGDRGGIVDRKLDGSPGDPAPYTISMKSPPAESFVVFRSGTLDRRVDMTRDPASDGESFAAPIARPGTTDGGGDIMRGGPDRDSMHGGFGDDLMNGDSGGDTLFGDHGADVMWGGKGCDPTLNADCANGDLSIRGAGDTFVDYLFGGYGGPPKSGNESAADILDYRPRDGIDPASWNTATDTGPGTPTAPHQHHQGTDWIYGGWDRDVLEADLAGNGPNPGDRLMDWPGATQLFVHCPSAYGGFNDVRQISPDILAFMENLAFGLGAGRSLAELRTSNSSGFVDVGLVYTQDVKANNGKAFSDTPGHFTEFSCEP